MKKKTGRAKTCTCKKVSSFDVLLETLQTAVNGLIFNDNPSCFDKRVMANSIPLQIVAQAFDLDAKALAAEVVSHRNQCPEFFIDLEKHNKSLKKQGKKVLVV